MLLEKYISNVTKYPLPIGFALIISLMIFTSFYAAFQMKNRADHIIESVEQQNLNNELLNTMAYSVLGRSLIAIEMLNTDDPFKNDDLYMELNELATQFVVSRARFESQDLSPNIQRILNTQLELIKVNAPTLDDVYTLISEEKTEKARLLFTDVSMPRQKINMNLIKDMYDHQYWESQDALKDAKIDNYRVLASIWVIIAISIFLSTFLTLSILKKQRKSDLKLESQATTDTLTRLPNRTSFIKSVDEHINTDSSSFFAIVFFDIDYFKHINDNFGHEVGDEVLQLFSEKIKSSIKASDILSRFGGDEFVLLLRSTKTEHETREFISTLSTSLDTFFKINNREIFISSSMGVSLYAQDRHLGQKDAKSLLKHADMAMYSAKTSGRNCFRFFTEEVSAVMKREHFLSHSLHTILKNRNSNHELSIKYQPLMNINNDSDNSFNECEALIRWTNSKGDIISPDEFIAVAEKSNLIEKINSFVIDEVCEQQNEWHKSGLKDIRININLSGNKLIFNKLLDQLEENINRLNIKAEYFGIELTERTLYEVSDDVIDRLDGLRKRGMKIAIDDFGTGYSSLTYLKKLPITTLKIDRDFIAGLPDDLDDFALVKTIINLGHTLGLDIVAEGVETKEQLDFLREHACNIAQGYYYYRPLKSEQILQLKLAA